MKKIFQLMIVALIAVSITGCSRALETARVVWGSSTRALEESRMDSVHKFYKCTHSECFNQVLAIANEKELVIFMQEPKKSRIVLMGIPGTTSATEVGIFFLTFGDTEKVEVVSLSPYAQEKAAEIIFSELGKKYTELK